MALIGSVLQVALVRSPSGEQTHHGRRRNQLMTDDLGKIAAARAIARRADRTVQENLFVGVGAVHVLCIIAALLGWIGPIQPRSFTCRPMGSCSSISSSCSKVRIKGAQVARSPASLARELHQGAHCGDRSYRSHVMARRRPW